MFYSGLVLTCRADAYATVGEILKNDSNIELFQCDEATHRYVVVLEEKSIDAETERFKALRAIPGVIDVSLVVHRAEGEEAPKFEDPVVEAISFS